MDEKVTIKARNENRIPPSSVAAPLTDNIKFWNLSECLANFVTRKTLKVRNTVTKKPNTGL